MTRVVLDSSALLAMLRDEPGGRQIDNLLPDAIMSAVNLAEVAGHFIRNGASREATLEVLAPLKLTVVDATRDHAIDAAGMLPITKAAGLSLADRFCLALARSAGVKALTTDRAWVGLALDGIEVELIR